MNRKTFLKLCSAVLPAAMLLSMTAPNVRAQGSPGQFYGSIYTSTGDGTAVNANLYDAKELVYLNGGPQNANANGLPDGTYFFQVTTPSGALLLSTDPAVNRQLIVSGGRVFGALPNGTTSKYGTVTATHATGLLNPANGSKPVQLIPFADTTNNGGEYKAWLIRQTGTTTIDPIDATVLHFAGKDTKTDNFKVKSLTPPVNPTTSLSGRKYFDANADGADNDGPSSSAGLGIGGVHIDVTVTPPVSDPPVAAYSTVVTTLGDGSWYLGNVPVGSTYIVTEELPYANVGLNSALSYWVQTAPKADSMGFQGYQGTAGDASVTGLDFGDLSFVPGTGGLTKGFWGNKNGQAILDTKHPAWQNLLNSYKLADAKGSFVITGTTKATAYSSLSGWMGSANAVNMAYMLSVQMSSTALAANFTMGLPASTIVDARTIYSLSSAGGVIFTYTGMQTPGLVSISDAISRANELLGMSGGRTTVAGSNLRNEEEMWKNVFDDINNSKAGSSVLYFGTTAPLGVYYPVPLP